MGSFKLLVITNNMKQQKYLSQYSEVFSIFAFVTTAITRECRKVLAIFELFLICLFTNAKLERRFSRMNFVKTDWCPILSRDCLDVLLRVSEEGPSLEEFNPDIGIACWYSDKVHHLNADPLNHPSKHKKSSFGKEVIDLATLTLSHFENHESMGCIFWLKK